MILPAMLRAVTSCLLIAIFMLPAMARSKPIPAPIDPDYIYALATANQFLHAWQTQDQETAALLLSDRLKQRSPETLLEGLLSNEARPQSFEIARGRKLAPGCFKFPIALFAKPTKAKFTHPHVATLVVIKTGTSEWAIDQLP
jgi:hypothetical protein